MLPIAPAHTPPQHVAIEMDSMDEPQAANAVDNARDPAVDQQAGGRGSWLLQQLRNAGVAVGRNLASVGIPTFAREMMRRTVFQQLANAAPGVAAAGAVVTGGVIPIGLQLAGIYREATNHTQTVASLASRVASIAMTGGSLVALAAVGGTPLLATAAPALMAANLGYTPMRDGAQHNLVLGDNTRSTPERPITGLATATGALAYIVNQTLVGMAMDAGGGAMANTIRNAIPGADVADSWTRGAAEGLGQGIARAGLNVIGETIDEMTLRGAQALTAGTTDDGPLRLSMHTRRPEERTGGAALDTLLNNHAGRQSLFASAYNTAFAVNRAGAGDNLTNFAAAGVLGLGYAGAIHTWSRKPPADQPVRDQREAELHQAAPAAPEARHQAQAVNPDIAPPSAPGLAAQLRAETEATLAQMNVGTLRQRPRA